MKVEFYDYKPDNHKQALLIMKWLCDADIKYKTTSEVVKTKSGYKSIITCISLRKITE